MAPRDPSTIKRDSDGRFGSGSTGQSSAQSLAEGLGSILKQRKKKAKASAREKAVLKTLATGEDKLGEFFDSSAEIYEVVAALEAAGMIVNDGTGYALTEYGISAITPKRRKKRS